MTDFVIAGQPYEPPESAADLGYAQTPAPFLSRVGAEIEGNITPMLERAIERGSQSDATGLDRALFESAPYVAYGAMPYSPWQPGTATAPAGYEPQQSDKLPAAAINERYAPVGPDGKAVPITDKPMSEGLGQIIGRQKTEEMQRESVIARNAAQNSWPVNFATGMATFMLDPINAATSFIPGIGEETALAALGRAGIGEGLVARMVARGVAGATAMGAQQVPLSLAQYGLGTEEASDFSFRDAMKQILYGAAWGAAIHGAFGTARELGIMRPDAVMGRPLGAPPAAEPETAPETAPPHSEAAEPPVAPAVRQEAAAVSEQPAPVRADAMRAAVAETLDGRPVDVQPVVDAAQSAKPANPGTIEQIMARENVGRAQAVRIQNEWLAAVGTPITSEEIAARRAGVASLTPAPLRILPPAVPSSVAEQQGQLARDGYATGLPSEDVRETAERVYEPAAETLAPAVVRPAEPSAGRRAAPTPYVTVPQEPRRLATFLIQQGGLRDTGGDVRATLGGARFRPGLVNASGMGLDDATLLAWQHGYFPDWGERRPEINDLLEKLDEDLNRGNPQYSHEDEVAAENYRAALAHNSEVDRLATRLGIDHTGMTHEQFFDAAAERMSADEAAQEAADQLASQNSAFEEAEQEAKAWVAYHGTPHDFDEFDASKIGTGEGAQAYGHGLYFAENPEVAGQYQRAVTMQHAATPERLAAEERLNAAIRASNAKIAELRERGIRPGTEEYDREMAPLEEATERARTEVGERPSGHLLTVEVHAKPEEMLDWDKTLSEQPEIVRNYLKSHPQMAASLERQGAFLKREPTGGALYRQHFQNYVLATKEQEAAASAQLRAAGIKGIRYLDQGSRAGGEGTRNVVIFDPRDVEITHRNGEPVAQPHPLTAEEAAELQQLGEPPSERWNADEF